VEPPPATDASASGDGRAISRAHVVIDHGPRDGVDNLVSIVGGKLTTYRLMARQTADVVVRKLGFWEPSTTAEEVLPGQGDGRTYWLGHRLAEHEAAGGGDANLICECELVTRPALDAFLDEHWPCSLDDVRRGTRLGMGPCQGGFCTFRAAGVLAERATSRNEPVTPAGLDATLADFVSERFRGVRPIAWGRQLQELWLTTGLYAGVLGVDSLPRAGAETSVPVQMPKEPIDALG
jgi:glycerol-3-phosphate dehydrogenase